MVSRQDSCAPPRVKTTIKFFVVFLTPIIAFRWVTCMSLSSRSYSPIHRDEIDANQLMDYLDACLNTDTIPRVVWTFWFSPNISSNRQQALGSMHETLKVPVIVLTSHNISRFLRWPVHPAVDYLSDVHKADFFRIYFMLHYGGGYSDVKRMVEPWTTFFTNFDDPNVWIVGVPEIPNGVAVAPGATYPADYYKSMISNGFMIARANNRILQEVHDMQNTILDEKLELLRKHPPPHPRCCQAHENGYPLRWAELLGEIMAFVAGKYIGHLSPRMGMPILSDYI
jgi:hypothetical protein